MNTAGYIFMILAMGLIVILSAYCLIKILRVKEKDKPANVKN